MASEYLMMLSRGDIETLLTALAVVESTSGNKNAQLRERLENQLKIIESAKAV